MRLEVTSHYALMKLAAEEAGAYSMSIQNAFTFVNFHSVSEASAFIRKFQPYTSYPLSINTQRGGGRIPAEVSVQHGKWIY
jgi:hypothetical protein